MKNKCKLVYVKGYEVIHSMWSKPYQGNLVEILAMVSNTQIIASGKELTTKCALVVSGKVDFKKYIGTNDFTPWNFHINPMEWHDATRGEKMRFTKSLKSKNLCWQTRQLQRERCDFYGKKYIHTFNYEGLFYLDKNTMRLRINNDLVLYKDLKEFNPKLNVVLSGDNGYSHWWSETTNANEVFSLIEQIFYNGGTAQRGEYYGWKFNYDCELTLQVTEKEFRHSVVSNS